MDERIIGYEGHTVCTMEKGHESVVVFIGIDREGYQFLKIDSIASDGITKELKIEKLQANFVSKTRRGHYVRFPNYSTRVYINDLIVDTGKLFEDICRI